MSEEIATTKMDDEMTMLHNVMPVELAIRREIEYRRKMEAIEDQEKSEHDQHVVPSQGSSTSQERVLKRKAQPHTFNAFLPLQPSLSCQTAFQKHPSGLVCKVCEVTFSTLFYLKKHSESGAHKDKLLKMKKRGENLSNTLYCELCKIYCSGAIVLEQHLNGIKHAASLQEMEMPNLVERERERERERE